MTDANVVTKCYGQKKTCFRVVDKGIGWNPEAGANDCKCGHERFSTARVISKKKYVPHPTGICPLPRQCTAPAQRRQRHPWSGTAPPPAAGPTRLVAKKARGQAPLVAVAVR